jgi:hypothetical protein
MRAGFNFTGTAGTTLDMKALVVVISVLLFRVASAEIIDEKRLEQAVQKLPQIKLDRPSATQLVKLAIEVAKDDLDPFVLLAQQYIESRYDSTATSRLIEGKRRVGSWPRLKAPPGWSGSLYCGIGQTVAWAWSSCLALRDPKRATAAQATELRTWLAKTNNDLTKALAGYGCGNLGLQTGRCGTYPQRVLVLAARLRKATAVVPLS